MKRIVLELLRGRVAGSETAQLAAAAAETEAKLGEARAAADAAREKKAAMAAAAEVGARAGNCTLLRLKILLGKFCAGPCVCPRCSCCIKRSQQLHDSFSHTPVSRCIAGAAAGDQQLWRPEGITLEVVSREAQGGEGGPG